MNLKAKGLKQLVDPLLIVLVWVIACVPFWTLNLTGDDWYFINSLVSNQYAWIDLRLARPFQGTFFRLLDLIWGINPGAYTLSAWFLWLATALVFYFFLRRVLSNKYPLLPLVASLIFVVHPAYQLRMWITAVHLSFALLVTLASAWLFFEYIQHGRWIWLAAALFAFALSLLDYEGQLGLVITWCLFLAVRSQHASSLRRISLVVGPLLIIGVALLWRLQLLSVSGSELDVTIPYLHAIQKHGFLLIEWVARSLYGIKVLMAAWLAPLVGLQALQGQVIVLVYLVLLFLVLIVGLIWKITEAGRNQVVEDKTQSIKSVLGIFLIGLAFALAGFFPMVLVFTTPALDFFTSRGNLFTLPGISVALTALLFLIDAGTKRLRNRPHVGVLSLVLVFILLGVIYQIEIQFESRRVWSNQRQIWHQMFRLAPDFSPGSYVVIIMDTSEYSQIPLRRDVIITPWGVDSAVQLLYEDPLLDGTILYLNRPDISHFAESGLWVSWPGEIVSPERLIMFHFDRSLQKLELVENGDWLKIYGANLGGYQPMKHILPADPKSQAYRFLVK